MRWGRGSRNGRSAEGDDEGGLGLIDLPSAPQAPTAYRFAGGDQAGGRAGAPPMHCQLRLWHSWRRFHVPGGGSYVSCADCGRDMPDPLFEPPWE